MHVTELVSIARWCWLTTLVGRESVPAFKILKKNILKFKQYLKYQVVLYMSTCLSSNMIKSARELLGWKQFDLAEASHLSISTIRRIEVHSVSANKSSMHNIIQTFSAHGIIFHIDENEVSITLKINKLS